MSEPWITNSRDRKSAKYQAKHEQLTAEVFQERKVLYLGPQSDKRIRHWARHEFFRLFGEAPGA